ncbi:thioesterase-like superfamily-domain-containing protein [Fusarium oxysporum Fo47]|uniref:thioesterase-like superfamily-domain-containing protein n=1 Tax=Fusarium oxysporum Fo47 TaxID=660027 RepID=UPI002869ACA7|nr:thioesterase-like superfamily-domain-containing protein [Fusarium oxysporum Fo47]WJG34720.1 thioesterase-like superfamily-domain-containing protein [Fusarium oxysporum Fo47]
MSTPSRVHDLMIVFDAITGGSVGVTALKEAIPDIIDFVALADCFERIGVLAYRNYTSDNVIQWSGWCFPFSATSTPSQDDILNFVKALEAPDDSEYKSNPASKAALAKAYQEMRAGQNATILLLYTHAPPMFEHTMSEADIERSCGRYSDNLEKTNTLAGPRSCLRVRYDSVNTDNGQFSIYTSRNLARKYIDGDEDYKNVIVEQLDRIISTNVSVIAIHPFYGQLWRAVCSDQTGNNNIKRSLLGKFRAQVSQIPDARDKKQAQTWLEESYTFFHEINEEISALPANRQFPLVCVDPDTIDLQGNQYDAALTRAQLLNIWKSCDMDILGRLGNVLIRMHYVQQEKDMPANRPASLLAAFVTSRGIIPLIDAALHQLVAFRYKWITTENPETWRFEYLSLLLEADRVLEKRRSLQPDQESILRGEDRKLLQTLVDYQKLEKSLTVKLSVKTGWRPSNAEAAVIHADICQRCNRRRSVTVMTSYCTCRYCSAGRNPIDAPEDHDDSTPVLWTECGSCQAQYVVDDDDKEKPPECFYCESGSAAPTVQCSECLSRIIWPKEIDLKDVDPSNFQCCACVLGVSTIKSRETTVGDLVKHNISSFLRNDDNVIKTPLQGESLFHITRDCDLAHFSSKVEVMPDSNSPLELDGKFIHNQTELKMKLRDIILPQEIKNCAHCLEENSSLQSVCTDTTCVTVMCTDSVILDEDYEYRQYMPGDLCYPSLGVNSRVTQQEMTTFTVNLDQAFAVGTVPHGGYISAMFLRAASIYLAPYEQPDTFAAHWHFLSATHIGPAVLIVEEVRRGRALSILHITLYQEGLLSESPWISNKSKKKVAAYVTNTLLNGEQGLSLPTGFELSAPPPSVDLTKLATDEDPNWERLHMVVMDVAPMMQHVEFYSPKYKQTPPATWDLWLRMSNNERWTTWALGYIADVAPALIIEGYRPTDLDAPVPEDRFAFDKIFWMPTVSMSLDVKKALPKEGKEWLRIRISAKVIKDGRYDAEVIVFDREDDVVALSNHVALVLDGERNWGRKEKL